MSNIADLENEFVLDGVDEIPERSRIFESVHIDYVDALMGEILLNDLKGQLLNILEGLGNPNPRQESALRRLVTNALHDAKRQIKADLELVKAE